MTEIITVENVNETYVKVLCSSGVAMELFDHFSFRAENFQFHPLYKQRLWDGYIRLFKTSDRKLLRGLVPKLEQFCKDRGYEFEYPDERVDQEFSELEAREFISKLNLPFTPDDEQVHSFVQAIRSRRKLIISPTGSGKSLLIYLISLYLLTNENKRGLIIVPRSALVEQLYSNYEEYSEKNSFSTSKYCGKIYSGQDRSVIKHITISTWQSLARMGTKFFEQFDYVICDEVHMAQAKELTKIVSNCVNAEYRIGTTGTLSGSKTHEFVLTGLFGNIHKAITTAELMEKKRLAQLMIKCLMITYPEEDCLYMKKQDYQGEIKYLIGHKGRNKFITNLALSLQGNSLVLFNYVENHGKPLYEMLKARCPERKVFFIHGGTDVQEREEIRKIVENETNAIIVGSVGVLSTGTNIVNLHNVIFASPSKSRIRNLQSIGRVLRRSEEKTSATLYDICDSFQHKKFINYTMRHFLERVKIYSSEKLEFKIYKFQLNNEKVVKNEN